MLRAKLIGKINYFHLSTKIVVNRLFLEKKYLTNRII